MKKIVFKSGGNESDPNDELVFASEITNFESNKKKRIANNEKAEHSNKFRFDFIRMSCRSC